jgi:hypothetical protein
VLGGKENQWEDLSGGNATNFIKQHDARFRSADKRQLSLFDNHGDNVIGCTANCSRGVLLDLDYTAMAARITHEYWHPRSISSDAMGNYGALGNGNVIIGWGLNPAFTEHRADGECVWDVQFAPWPASRTNRTNANYRIYKDDWMAFPTWPPAVAAEDGVVYVSWNGATEVMGWAVYTASSSPRSLMLSTVVAKDGFETAIAMGEARYVQARALDRNGDVLPHGISAVLKL